MSVTQTRRDGLPTAPGWYTDRANLPWLLREDGTWFCGYKDHGPATNAAPFVRLIPETELEDTDTIKTLLERALHAIRANDERELRFLVRACDNPNLLEGDA